MRQGLAALPSAILRLVAAVALAQAGPAGLVFSADLNAAPVQAALDDAARATGVPAASLRVVPVERVTWLDGSLGCPEPESMYTQALVSGFRIRIESDGRMLDYHADTRGALLLCPPERAMPPASTP